MFGDVLARLVLSSLLVGGLSWQQVFYFGAAVVTVITLVSFFTLKSSPISIGEKVKNNVMYYKNNGKF